MTPFVVTEPFQISPEWSWLFVAWIFPFAPLAFAAWWLVGAVRYELQRRAVLSPPLGYRAVEGTIGRDRNPKAPAVEATFELTTKKLKGGRGYRLRSHTLSVRPFTLETDGGQHFEVKPDRDTVALHAPLEGAHSSRSSRVRAGDRVWIYGATQLVATDSVTTADNIASNRERKSEQRAADGKPLLLISTVPIADVFRAERNRRLWLAAAAAAFLVVTELVVFGGYWEILQAGEPVVGRVVDKGADAHKYRERTGSSYWDVDYSVVVDVRDRREELAIAAKSWAEVEVGTPVELLASPATVMFGPEPHTTLIRCVVMSALIFFGVFGFVIAGLYQRPWYSVKRGWRGMDRPPLAQPNTEA